MNKNVEPLKIIEASIKNKEFNEALNLCNKYNKSISKRDYFYLTSVCYRYLNELDKAIKGLDNLIQIDPKYGRAFQEFGHVHVLLKDSFGHERIMPHFSNWQQFKLDNYYF